MRKYFVPVCINFLLINAALAQNAYDVKNISPALLVHANVVKRTEELRIDIKDVGRAVVYHKYALTILNAGGDDAAGLTEYYDQLINIQDIDGNLYDGAGKKIRSLKKGDIKDISGTDGSSLADDDRIKMHNFNWKIYPYTVEYETALEFKGIFYLPHWLPVENEMFAVEKSRLIVQCPLDYKLRYKTFNYAKLPQITTVKQSLVYEWDVEQLPAVEEEKYEPEWYEITPSVFVAPSDFAIQHYSGSMTDWKGLGKFIYTLNNGRDRLPDNIKQQVHSLTDNLKTQKEKTRVLYEFLQKNTHYISVQLGIGGWQTFDANYVATKGYGDCKALSNYMYSLLKEAGIKAYYTLVKAGENRTSLLSDFPSNQFNHIIVCVPQVSDTIWLECTSETLPMGYLGGFTCNRNALLIDETGGMLVHTPIYKNTDNLQSRKITGVVNDDGLLTAKVITSYQAQQQDYLHGMLESVPRDKVTEILKAKLDIPSYDITNFDYTDEKGAMPLINETLELTANNYCTISGRRLFIAPNILNRSSSRITNAASRKFDVNLSPGFMDIDSVEISIPAAYTPESVPADIAISTKFGTYNSTLKVTPGKIIYIRKSQRNCNRYPAADAVALAEFLNKVYIADRAKLVFVKQEGK